MRDATFSADRKKRFELICDWSDGQPQRTVNFAGLNPSIAGVGIDDMTVRKDIGFAKRWGFNRIVLTNLIADISTDPWGLPCWKGFDPENIKYLHGWANRADLFVACWGSQPKAIINRIALLEHVLHLKNNTFRRAHCIGRTKSGHPSHPSRVAYTDEPVLLWDGATPIS